MANYNRFKLNHNKRSHSNGIKVARGRFNFEPMNFQPVKMIETFNNVISNMCIESLKLSGVLSIKSNKIEGRIPK